MQQYKQLGSSGSVFTLRKQTNSRCQCKLNARKFLKYGPDVSGMFTRLIQKLVKQAIGNSHIFPTKEAMEPIRILRGKSFVPSHQRATPVLSKEFQLSLKKYLLIMMRKNELANTLPN